VAGDSDEEERKEGEPEAPPKPRPSLRPSAPPARPANQRIVFAAIWILVQIVLVVTASRRADGAFGFRMFAESAGIKVALFRDVAPPVGDGRGSAESPMRVHVDGGVWNARGADGVVRRKSWYDRVPFPRWVFDQEMHASYGAATQLARLQAALDDVTAHLTDDTETLRLVLVVVERRNGREPVQTTLTGPTRRLEVR
jgi:hypothetical protein